MLPPPRAARVVAAIVFVVAVGALPDRATARQTGEPVPEVTRTLAVRNAHLVPRPGVLVERATVVIRDGLITAAGPDARIPFDARIVEGDSIWVYAGFVDALSTAGVPAPERDRNPEPVADPDNPPPSRAGIRPDRDVRSLLEPGDKSVESLRSAGFTVAHVVPHDGMLSGRGALILLAGSTPESMVVRGDVSAMARYAGARGVYPSTPMAIAAEFRQLYHETGRRATLEERYERDPVGMAPPPWDAVHEALVPVVDGSLPVFFFVRSALEAHRALSLREDLGFRMVLAGLNEGYELTDRLVRSGVPLVVTLDLPEKPDWMAKVKADSLERMIASYDPDRRTATFRDLEAEIGNLRARQARSRRDYVENASSLHAAGLRFAFGTMGAKPSDVSKNLTAIVSAGLPAEAALAALTTNGAEVLGQSEVLGTVDVGKIGNLVLTTGPLFEEETRISHVVVSGTLFEVDLPGARSDSVREARGFAGSWSVTVHSTDGPITGTVEITGSDDDPHVVVTYEGAPSGIAVSGASVDGNTIRFSFQSPDGFVSMRLTRDGDHFSGVA